MRFGRYLVLFFRPFLGSGESAFLAIRPPFWPSAKKVRASRPKIATRFLAPRRAIFRAKIAQKSRRDFYATRREIFFRARAKIFSRRVA